VAKKETMNQTNVSDFVSTLKAVIASDELHIVRKIRRFTAHSVHILIYRCSRPSECFKVKSDALKENETINLSLNAIGKWKVRLGRTISSEEGSSFSLSIKTFNRSGNASLDISYSINNVRTPGIVSMSPWKCFFFFFFLVGGKGLLLVYNIFEE